MSAAVARVDEVAGHEAVILENTHLRAVILPGLGGRVWNLEDRVRNREWIWHRESVPLEAQPPGALYDDVWAGGWEELFPNDSAGVFEGRNLPDHGEWWTMAFEPSSSIDSTAATVTLRATSRIIRAECTKTFRLAHDLAALTVSYRVRSLEERAFHFLFKQHLPVRISPGCRLTLPGGQVEPVDPAFGTLLDGAGARAWPGSSGEVGRTTDLRVILPAASQAREFVYVKDLPDAWCGVVDHDRDASLRMEFDPRQLPYVWLFLSYGGWRDTYTAVLEPCTNLPKDLAEAVRLGQAARLSPGEEFSTTATVRLGGLEGAAS